MTEFQSLFKDASIQQFNSYSQSIFKQLSICHTAQKGMHRLRCSEEKCGKEQVQYHACGNRHCPHCGGFKREEWISAKRKKNNFLFPEKSLQKMYKAKFLNGIAKLNLKKEGLDYDNIIREIGFKKWNVYAKAQFGGPAQVVEYVGRYTHKIAITKHRIVSVNDKEVSFRYKDYADDDKQKIMTLSRVEFLRRFELHFLPSRFTKIRHYGFLQNNSKRKRLNLIRELLKLSSLSPIIKIPVQLRILEKYGKDITLCPCCKVGKMELIETKRFTTKTSINQSLNRFTISKNKEPTLERE